MILEPKVIRHALHPFVASAYISDQGRKNRVLVINAIKHVGTKQRTRLYHDFLAKLDLISTGLKKEGSAFDRMDIHFS